MSTFILSVDDFNQGVSIRVGNDALPVNNAICVDNIAASSGLFICKTALVGDHLGLYKERAINSFTAVTEIRAYSEVPVNENDCWLSSFPTTATLTNALRTTASSAAMNYDFDNADDLSLAGTGVYFMIDL